MDSDNTTAEHAQQELNKCALQLAAMSDDVAKAKQIKEYDGDRKKRALAEMVVVFLEQGEGASASEHRARASKPYGDSLIQLGSQFREALRVIEKYEAVKTQWETWRSWLSMEKVKAGML